MSWPGFAPILLLFTSNVFMTFAWYGHLRNQQLPLWKAYRRQIDSPVADLNNVSSRPYAGATVAALFMKRFLAPATNWIHLDLYAWNDSSRPGRPEGGEAMGIRALLATIERRLSA